MHYVHLPLSQKDGDFYIGYTSDLRRRLNEHSNGKNSSTKSRRPFKLIYYEAHLSKMDTLRRERYFKTTAGRSTLRQMLRKSMGIEQGIQEGGFNLSRRAYYKLHLFLWVIASRPGGAGRTKQSPEWGDCRAPIHHRMHRDSQRQAQTEH